MVLESDGVLGDMAGEGAGRRGRRTEGKTTLVEAKKLTGEW